MDLRKGKLLQVTIGYDRFGEFKAMMYERIFKNERFFYLMDLRGQHEFVSEKEIGKFKTIGHIETGNANNIVSLLVELNGNSNGKSMYSYVWNFKQVEKARRRMEFYDDDLPF